jgi:hypothetical protein
VKECKQPLQNYFYLTPKLWKSWQSFIWGKQLQGQKFCLLPDKSVMKETRRSQEHVPQECLYTDLVECPHPLSPALPISLAMMTPYNTRGAWWPWTSGWKRYSNGILLWLVVQPMYRSSNKKLPVRNYVSIGTVWYSRILDNSECDQSGVCQINGILPYMCADREQNVLI